MKYQVAIGKVLRFLSEPSSRMPLLWLLAAVIPVGALAALTLYNGPIHVMAPWDVLGLLEGGWRSYSGLIHHTDFYDPIGSLTYEFISIGMHLGGLATVSIVYSILLFLLIAAPWSWFVASHRMSGFMAAVFTAFNCLIMVAARPLGYDPGITTYAMIYNRYGWALLSILLLQVFVAPRAITKRGGTLEEISIGGLLVLLFFCKVSYFGVGLAAAAIGAALRPSLIRSSGYAAGTFVTGCLLWWILFDVSALAYLSDIVTAGSAQSSGHRLQFFINSVKANAWPLYVLALLWLVVLLASFESSGHSAWLSRKVRLCIALAYTLCATFAIAATNAPEGTDLPLYFVMGAVIIEFVTRYGQRGSARGLSSSEIVHVIALLVVLPGFALPIAAKDALSIYHAVIWREYRESTVPESQRFNAAPLRDLVIPHTSEWKTAYWRAKDVPSRINEGMSLLRRHVNGDTRLFVVAFTNPFSFALQLPPPKGPPLWWDIDYSVSADAFPEPDAIFAKVDMVIIPLLHDEDDGCCKGTVHRMMEVYGGYLGDHFVEVERTANWVLMIRKGLDNSTP